MIRLRHSDSWSLSAILQPDGQPVQPAGFYETLHLNCRTKSASCPHFRHHKTHRPSSADMLLLHQCGVKRSTHLTAFRRVYSGVIIGSFHIVECSVRDTRRVSRNYSGRQGHLTVKVHFDLSRCSLHVMRSFSRGGLQLYQHTARGRRM